MSVYGKRSRWINLLIVLTFAVQPIFAQTSRDAQLQEALRLLNIGRSEEALRMLKSINKETPGDAAVIRRIAEIEFEAEKWSSAKDWYFKILEANSGDADAVYHLGIIYRETGKYKALILRDRDWNRSENYFVSLVDSVAAFPDVNYQFALLEHYRKEYARAVEMAEKQTALNPTPRDVVALFRFAESFLYNEGAVSLRRWADDQDQHSAVVDFFIAESYRFDKKFSTADSIYARLSADSASALPRVPLLIAWAKSGYEQNDSRRAQQFYEQSLAAVTNDIETALMFDHIKYILADEELAEYEKLTDWSAKRAFFNKVWLTRNPMPASDINYRIIEHIRRYILAERDYYYDDFRLPYNNPDRLHELVFPRVFELNDKFNDKGLVYIRHGEPDDRAFDIQSDAPLNESWLYYARGQLQHRMIFHFIQGDTQTGNNWRLSPSLPFPLLESRISWDPIYSRIINGTAIEAIAYEREMVMNSRENVRVGLNTDQHSWSKSVRTIIFPFYLATFQGGPDLSRCELYYAVSDEDVMPPKGRPASSDSVIVNFAVYDADLKTVFTKDKKVSIQSIIKSTETLGYWPDQLSFTAPAGRYQIAIDVRTPQDEAIGGYKFKFNLSDYSGDAVQMSGVVLASSITPAAETDEFYKNGLRVVPNPGKLFSRKQPMSIYFELYNLPVQKEKSFSFQVEYTLRLLEEKERNILQVIQRVFRNPQPSTSNRIERSANSKTSAEYIALDLRKYVPGIYELQVSALAPGVQDSLYKKINFELK
jgi:hypothetical protein